MTIPEDVKDELIGIIRTELERQGQRKMANKWVYCRVCEKLDRELRSFDYIRPAQYRDKNGVNHSYNDEVYCNRRIQDAIGTLLRIIYRVDATAKLPAEQEQNISAFVVSVLEMMKRTSPFPNTDN